MVENLLSSLKIYILAVMHTGQLYTAEMEMETEMEMEKGHQNYQLL